MISAFNLIQTYAETFRCEKSARNIIFSSTREFWNFRSKTKSWNFEEVRWRPFSPKESFLNNILFNTKGWASLNLLFLKSVR